MAQALISPNERVYSYDKTYLGERIAQVEPVAFEVAPPLFWATVPDTVVADQYYWDGTQALPIPVKPPVPPPAST